MIDLIHWLGNSSFALHTTPTIYINPRRVSRGERPADVILISSDHYENCSPADVAKLRQPHTLILGTPSAAEQIEGCQVLRPWQSVSVNRACIKGVPAYVPTLSQSSNDQLGFVISVNYYDIYYAGKTGITPEMQTLHPDIALLPVDGAALNPHDAATAVSIMQPRYAVPYNWGFTSGGTNRVDALLFANEVGSGTEVVLLEPGK